MVTDTGYTAETEKMIEQKLIETLGSPVNTTFNYMKFDEIPTENKHRYVESDIVHEYLR